MIEVAWPPLALNDTGWIERLNDLAAEAEQLVGRTVGLQRTAELGLQMVGLLWPGFSPETVAASCRASALLGVPILMSTAPADQVAEIAERLDSLYAAAQADPAAGLVELAPPLLQRVAPPGPRTGKKLRKAEPEDHPAEPEPITHAALVDHPVELPELPEWEPEDHPPELAESPEPEPAPAPSEDPDELPAAWRDCATPEPAPEPPAPPTPAADTTGWLLASETAELLGISPATLSRWRQENRLGDQGVAWVHVGRNYVFEPGRVEAVMDQLVSSKQAKTERVRFRISDQRPDGWMTPNQVGAAAGWPGTRVRELLRHGRIPAELVLCLGERSRWINPVVVEMLRSGDIPAVHCAQSLIAS